LNFLLNIKKIFEDWLIIISLLLSIFLFLLGSLPTFKIEQLIPIFLLWILFITVKGIQESKILNYIAIKLNNGNFVAQKIVILSFISSIVLTIDVTLIVLLPITLLLNVKNKKTLFLLVAFTAHLGAALTPFGTPQNIFIFSYYHIDIDQFIKIIAPFSIYIFIIFFIISFFVKVPKEEIIEKKVTFNIEKFIIFLLLLIFAILVSIHLLPWYLGIIIIIISAIYDKNSLKVDYALLITFIIFIAISNQLKELLSPYLHNITEPLFISIILSQFISNIGSTLLLHNFTNNYSSLLIGSNIGSFGTPIAALANLITYKIYISHNLNDKKFIITLTFWGLITLFISYFTIIYN